MNGAESLIRTLVNNNVNVCFTNPGTSEMHFVAALDEVSGMRCILCLFEGVLSGAAGAYALMAEQPACTLLHLGPGLGNAIANMHNAKKGKAPIINIIGDHATYHLKYDAPLTSDIEAMAKTVSHWVYTSQSAAEISSDAIKAIKEAGKFKISSLILPADVSWGINPNGPEALAKLPETNKVSLDKIERAAQFLQSGEKSMIMIGGQFISESLAYMLGQIKSASGVRICTEVFPSRITRGAGTPIMERLPYMAEQAMAHLEEIEHLVLVGASEPVSFFAYPNVPSQMAPETCSKLVLAEATDDIEYALAQLLGLIADQNIQPELYPLNIPELPEGDLTPLKVAATIAHHIPENAIVVDEAITSGLAIFPMTSTSRKHDWLNLTGGSIGWGLPAAVGAAVACPERKVICLEGDGSAMYTIQALWTMAREDLDILIVIFNNRKYSILELEFAKTGARSGVPGPKAASMLAIGNPELDFVSIAHGMGVSAARASTAEEFNEQFERGVNTKGPFLIDAVVPTLF